MSHDQPRDVTTTPYTTWAPRGVDLIAVERRLAGDWPVPELSDAELEYALGRLEAAGVPDEDAADRLGVCARTLVRWRAARQATP